MSLTEQEILALAALLRAGWRESYEDGLDRPIATGVVEVSRNAHFAIRKLFERELWLASPVFRAQLVATIAGSAEAVVTQRISRIPVDDGSVRDRIGRDLRVSTIGDEIGRNASQSTLFLITEPPTTEGQES